MNKEKLHQTSRTMRAFSKVPAACSRAYLFVRAMGVCGVCILYILLSVRCVRACAGVPIVCLAIWHWYMLRGDWLKSE
jgi:hypothetical protein